MIGHTIAGTAEAADSAAMQPVFIRKGAIVSVIITADPEYGRPPPTADGWPASMSLTPDP
jgi:hypothetical protein